MPSVKKILLFKKQWYLNKNDCKRLGERKKHKVIVSYKEQQWLSFPDTKALDKFLEGVPKHDRVNVLSDIKPPAQVKEDQYLTLHELFDASIANHLMKNQKKYKAIMRPECFEKDGIAYDPFTALREFFKRSKNGVAEIMYKQNNAVGRFCNVGGIGFQTMCREFRHSIQSGYVDLDVKNCHPVILSSMCHDRSIPCPALDDYISNRDKRIKELGFPDDKSTEGKKIFLHLTNGGTKAFFDAPNTTEFLTKFREELKGIHKFLCESDEFKNDYLAKKNAREDDGKDWNHMASFVNTLMCDIENKILMCMWKKLGKKDNAVLCFDGIMVPCKSGKVSTEILDAIAKEVLVECKISVEVVQKKMNLGFSFKNEVIEPYVDIPPDLEDKYNRCLNMIRSNVIEFNCNDNTHAQLFYTMMCDDIITLDGSESGDGYLWDPDECIWKATYHSGLQDQVCKPRTLIIRAIEELIFKYEDKKTKSSDDEKIKYFNTIIKGLYSEKNKLQTTHNIRDLWTLAKGLFKDKNDEFVNSVNRNHDLLPIENGLTLDLQTGETRQRTKADNFSLVCPVNYIKHDDWTDDDKVTLNKLIGPIFLNDQDYIDHQQIKMGSYLSGRSTRDIDVNHGDGKNGKSGLVHILQLMLGQFCGFISKDVIVTDEKSKKMGKSLGGHTSYLMPIDGKRLIITQELEEGDTLNSNMVKKIASADPIEGVRECFGRKTRIIIPCCSLLIGTNYVMKWNCRDTAVTDRLVIYPYNARFLDKESMKSEKESGNYNPNKYKYFIADKPLLDSFCVKGRNLDILFSWMVIGCMKFYKVMNDGIKKPKIVLDYTNTKFDDNDVVGQWIAECCEFVNVDEYEKLSPKAKKGWVTQGNDLWNNFTVWAKKNNCLEGNGRNIFHKILSKKFPKTKNMGGVAYERIIITGGYDDNRRYEDNSGYEDTSTTDAEFSSEDGLKFLHGL